MKFSPVDLGRLLNVYLTMLGVGVPARPIKTTSRILSLFQHFADAVS